MSRYEHGVDSNTAEIVQALNDLHVWSIDMAGVPRACPNLKGLPDRLCYDLLGAFWLEIKTDKGELRKEQREFAALSPIPVYEVRSGEDVTQIVLERRAQAVGGRGCPERLARI